MGRFIIMVTLVIFLGGCVKTVYIDENGNEVTPPQQPKQIVYLSETEERFEIVEEIGRYLDEVRDVTTGVHYYFYRINSASGFSGFTPVYESDGSVRVTNK